VPLERGEVLWLEEPEQVSALPAPLAWGSSVEGQPEPARTQFLQRSPHWTPLRKQTLSLLSVLSKTELDYGARKRLPLSGGRLTMKL